jgi:hypothetical protein
MTKWRLQYIKDLATATVLVEYTVLLFLLKTSLRTSHGVASASLALQKPTKIPRMAVLAFGAE